MKEVKVQQAVILSALAAAALMGTTASSAADIMARVITSTPVVQQIAVPRQVCNTQQVVTQAPKSGGGALLGAVAGGAAGNAIGSGGGRAVATMLGVFGGALLGDNIEGPGRQQVQNVQQCSTQTYYENRPSHYNVVYEYQGTQYTAVMPTDPGQYVRLQVSPVGAVMGAPQAGLQNNTAPQLQQPPPQAWLQPQEQGVYFQPEPVYSQQLQAAPMLVYQTPQVVYVQPYAPRSYYAPAAVSLNLGYSRGYGYGYGYGGRHRHWR